MSQTASKTEIDDTQHVRTDITLQEWSKSGPLHLSERDLEMIDEEINSNRTQIDYEHDQQGRTKLRTTHYVGIVSLPDGPVVEITPKAAGDNLLSLFRYARGIDPEVIDSETAVPEGREFIDAIAALYLDELNELMRHGLHTDYRHVQDTQEYLRGQIDVQRQIQRQGKTGTQFECSYDEITADTVENQSILYATTLLTRLVSDSGLRQGLKRHEMRLRRQVSLRPVQRHELENVELTRLNEHYAEILRLTDLIIRRVHIENFTQGDYPSFSILMDMNQIFESVVERAAREAVSEPEDWSVEGQAQVRGLVTGGKYPVRMRPDFVVRDELGEPVLVGDAKWKVGTPKQSDIYQITAYQLADDVPGLLVYPAQGSRNVTEYTVMDEHSLRLIELPTDKRGLTYEGFIENLSESVRDELSELTHLGEGFNTDKQ